PQNAREGYRLVFREGQVRDYPLEIRHRAGRITPVLYNATVYRDNAGNVSGVFAAARDITKLKQAEIEREQFYKFFLASSDIMVIADPNGAFLKTNPACTEVLGYSQDELITKPFIEFIHPDDRQPTLEEMARQQQLGYTMAFENRYLCKDGSVRWLSWQAVYNRDENQTYATGRDITLNKHQEEALRKSEREFRLLAEAMPQIVWICDPAGKNIYFNQQWMGYTGLTLEESLGHGWNKPFHPDDQQMAWGAWQNAINNLAEYSLECRLRRADGVYKWWLVRGVPVQDDQGAVIKWFGTCTDIDEFKNAELERLSLEKQLLHAQKLESLGILAGGIAHDFNNILMAILGNAELARMKLAPESPLVPNLQQIEQAAMRAADLAKQMLAYSGKGKFIISKLNLNHIIEEMKSMLEVSISRKAILKLNLAPDLPSVEADSSQIQQIIMNLVINASEAIGAGCGFITIRTGSMECAASYLAQLAVNENMAAGNYVFLEITDTGSGMSKETQSRIFDPFFTTKFTGRGLGMAAVHGIIRGHRGGICIYSELGKGTSFKVLLPAIETAVGLIDTRSSDETLHGNGAVLLVDDEEVVLNISAEMLKELGFSVIVAKDGVEALELYKSGVAISCVILDLTMPRMDGEQCFRELRQLDPAIKIIMSSGYNEQEIAEKFENLGVNHFIQKPYNFSELKAALKSVLYPL
ncbi:MAG: PAS domain S-box protein, partial [Geobacter sp.]|nr:PAS domain S-box protein [Geobacter sp.]